jgi:Ca2+-transporting ATPase
VGAPEEILKISSKIWGLKKTSKLSSFQKNKLQKIFLKMSAKGLRVLAVAKKDLKKAGKISDQINNLEFVGFLGIEDSLKPEVNEAIDEIKKAGIEPVMITGDHKITAQAIAKQAGIFDRKSFVLEGRDIENLTEKQLAKKLTKVHVFARVTPLHKLKIINAYKIANKTVAMTGDGVNDALSLTSADVGVAMGKIGTEVAKEASDIVILDDNIGSIVAGIEEGKNILKTIKRVVLYLFSTSFGEFLTILIAILIGWPLPILATQILWLNLVTDGFLDIALAMEPKREGLKLNREREENIIDKLMLFRIGLMGAIMAIGTLFLFGQYFEKDLTKAWTISLTTLAVFQWFNAWNCRSRVHSIFQMNPFSNKFLIGATGLVVSLQILIIYNSFFQTIFKTTALKIQDWFYIISIAFLIVLVEEFRKLIIRFKFLKK